ncbi:MAG: ABC transporter permease [Bacteroidota bacterium]|nr:ABC transporter permease [Candidatus Kapabacteria bacterium]MDW8219497.1 ABC transporter permease [Bacteroidota bacterium]
MRVLIESIVMALDAVRANKLRSGLTLLSIAIGIFAIIGAGTAVTSLNTSVNGELASLGQNTFQIRRRPSIVLGSRDWIRYRNRKPIDFVQAREFKRRMESAEAVSVNDSEERLIVKANNLSTDPTVTVSGIDEGYFLCTNVTVDEGRELTAEDITLNRPVVIIGRDVAERLFPFSSPIGQQITIKGHRFTVIGLQKRRGAILGSSLDNIVYVPITLYQKYFAEIVSLTIYVKAPSKEALGFVIDEAIGVMRTIRNVKPGEDNNFEIETNESLAASFSSLTEYLTTFGFASGAIALIAAGVGIMNIMLVSVKERTREIGVRKAIGATRSNVMSQFVIEAVTLCQIGGIFGILLGLLGGLALSVAMGFQSVSVPLDWLVGSVVICTVLGVLFGSYPAWKAASLDPIEALRYE